MLPRRNVRPIKPAIGLVQDAGGMGRAARRHLRVYMALCIRAVIVHREANVLDRRVVR